MKVTNQEIENGTVTVYEEEGHPPARKAWMSDPSFREYLNCCVVVDVDTVIIDSMNDVLYLAKRTTKPAQGWLWALGGKLNPFENTDDASVRFLHEDAGIDVSPDRVKLVTMTRYMWREIAQDDVQGSDNLCFTYAVELTAEERSQVVLSGKEYDQSFGLVPIGRYDLERITAPMRDLYYEIFGR